MSTKTATPARDRAITHPHIYLCDLCGKEFLAYNQMRRHRLDCKEEINSRGMARDLQPAQDYKLPYWRCPKCGYRIGPATLSFRYQLCQKWQDMMGTGKKCDGKLTLEKKEVK